MITKIKVAILIGVLLILSLGGYVFYQSQYGMINRAKEAIKDKLTDGDSAKFRNVRKVNSETVCGEVNGKNRLGAYVGFSKFHVRILPNVEPFITISGADKDDPIILTLCADTPTSAQPSSSGVGSTAVISKEVIQAAEPWKYEEYKNEMTGKVTNFATNESINTVNFDSPYEGDQHGTIDIFDGTVIFRIGKGQLVCNGGGEYGTCQALVKFDDGKAENVDARVFGDKSTTISFTNANFLENLKLSKKLTIQVNVYQNGLPVFTFDVSGLKQIPAPTKSTDSNESKSADKVVGTESYVVQVGAYAYDDSAKQELDKLKKWGFKAYIEKSGDKIRVRVGPYTERDKADKVRKLLEKYGLHPTVMSAR